ncbi:MAG: YqgE/AlgH family protein [Gammaproteobacteria bacterium]|nr:YqgE/AlgH family protein [Gammaproteobacteria bacterium]
MPIKKLNTTEPQNKTHPKKPPVFLLLSFLFGTLFQANIWANNNIIDPLLAAKGPILAPQIGRFLVATDNLLNTSFKETVIFITHFSNQGAAGIAINRPANIPLNEAFPSVKSIQGIRETLFLGGPVRTNAIFVLMKTKRAHNYMSQITNGIYFATGLGAISHGHAKLNKDEAIRAYAGFAGWSAGQLQREIKRGDWLIVETDPQIVFETNTDPLWIRLHRLWSGNWI